MTEETNQTNGPADTLRDGALKATIWRNESKNGAFFTADITRTYTDESGNFYNTQGFSRNQLLQVARLADQAYGRIRELEQAEKQTQSNDNQTQAA